MHHASNRRGYITLISVLVVGAAGTAIATTLLLFGIGAAKTGVSLEQSHRAKAFVNACMEEALQQIRDATSFTGTAALSFPEGSCTYTVTNQGGTNRLVVASSTVGAAIRRARAAIDRISPSMRVPSWQEVGEF